MVANHTEIERRLWGPPTSRYMINAKGAVCDMSKVEFAQSLSYEEQRHIAEGLWEEELAVFDLLTREWRVLTARKKREVQRVARELLETLKREKLVLDWRKAKQPRAAVQLAIEEKVCAEKSAVVYQFVYDHYWGAGQSVYAV